MANKILLSRATETRIESIKELLLNYEIVYANDTIKLGVKHNDGTVKWFSQLKWENIENKPLTFTPSPHTHNISDITDLQNKLNQKLDRVWTDVMEQTSVNITDYVVINREGAVFKSTVGNLLGDLLDTDLFIIVQTLPETGVSNKIYLVPTGEQTNAYEEYIWLDNKWEPFGLITIDLSNYFNKQEITSMLLNYLPLSGGEMSGDISMGYNGIFGVRSIEFMKNEEEAHTSLQVVDGAFQVNVNDRLYKFGYTELNLDGADLKGVGDLEADVVKTPKLQVGEVWNENGSGTTPINVKSEVEFDGPVAHNALVEFGGDVVIKDGAVFNIDGEDGRIYMGKDSAIVYTPSGTANDIKIQRNLQTNNQLDITGATVVNFSNANAKDIIIDGGEL